MPDEPVPTVVPDLAIEAMSEGNTLTEMSRMRREYFHAGVRLVWMVDSRRRTVAVYTAINDYELLDENQTLCGGDVLPGLDTRLADVFGELDRRAPELR